jgi:hypothetical protein
MIDYVVIVEVEIDREIVESKLEDVLNGDEMEVVAARSARPVLGQVGQEGDVISDEEDLRLIERDVENPVAMSVPDERGRHRAEDL